MAVNSLRSNSTRLRPKAPRPARACLFLFPVEEESTVSQADSPHEALGSEANLPPIFWRAAWLIAFFTLAASSDTFLLLKAKEIGMAAGWLPVLWAFSNAVKSAFSMWGGGLSDRFGRRRLMLAAWTLYAACYAGFAFVTSDLAARRRSSASTRSTTRCPKAPRRRSSPTSCPPRCRGRAFGWMNGLTGFAALPASVGFGLLWQDAGSRTAFLTGAAIAAVAAAGLLVLRFPGPVPPGKIRRMSGPVWKRLRLKGTCDACGETCDELLASGTVSDFAFTPDSRYCLSCYDALRGPVRRAEPRAVDEQQAPPVISRPISTGDMPD